MQSNGQSAEGEKPHKSYAVQISISESGWNSPEPEFRAKLYQQIEEMRSSMMKHILSEWKKDHND